VSRASRCLAFAGTTALYAGLAASSSIAAPVDDVRTVRFPSDDGRTELVAYLFEPTTSGPHPAVVMLHGRSGPYSANVHDACRFVRRDEVSACDASTLSQRHRQWGRFWAEHGFVALLVDSFGPRGKGHGFGRGTHGDADRDDVDERTVRPLDAEAAGAWLAAQRSVDPSRVFVQGWSNGASTALNVMERQAARESRAAPRFRAALVFYPGCGPAALHSTTFTSDAPVTVFLAGDDEEVSPRACRGVLEAARALGVPVDVVWYDGATHDFDDPGQKRQGVPANRAARLDAMRRSLDALSTGAPLATEATMTPAPTADHGDRR